jgi:hypothetical protein
MVLKVYVEDQLVDLQQIGFLWLHCAQNRLYKNHEWRM